MTTTKENADKLDFTKVKNYYSLRAAYMVAQVVKNLPAMWETQVRFLDSKIPLQEGMATHSSIPAWRIPQTEGPGRLQSTGLQRVIHYCAADIH